jgi:hypothetical protein
MRPSIRRPVLPLAPLAAALLALACAGAAARAPGAVPLSGAQLVARMRERYAGRWFRTLTFTQRTTRRLPDGSERVSTWLEATEAPDKLRIDMGPREDGNGALFRGDSTYRIVGGRVTRVVAEGNPFMPFVVGIYTQPLDRSLGELAREKYDMARVRLDRWRGREVQVVGASSAADTTSPQFWVDLDRLVAVRVLLPAGDGSGAVQELRLDGYRRVGGSWVATEVSILVGGKELQREEYSDVRVDVPLSPALFDPASWSSAPHWAARGSSAR